MTRPGPAGLRRFVAPGPATPPETGPGSAPPSLVAPPEKADRPPVPDRLTISPDAFAAAAVGEPDAGDQAGTGTEERCELCATPLAAEHGHVADLEASSLLCACRPCYLLFTQSEAGGRRYRAVPDRYLTDPGAPLAPAQWDELEIPVGLAFFLTTSAAGRVTGFYPSPAGATECVLDLGAWDRLAAGHPLLGQAAPDVEAILISRTNAGAECFLVPIDACYELAGRMRLLWRGFDGGAEARASMAGFLDQVRSRARSVR